MAKKYEDQFSTDLIFIGFCHVANTDVLLAPRGLQDAQAEAICGAYLAVLDPVDPKLAPLQVTVDDVVTLRLAIELPS